MNKIRLFLLFFLLVLTACEPQAIATEAAVEILPTATPTETQQVDQSQPVNSTATPIPPTLTPVVPDFSGVTVYVVTRLKSGLLMVTLSGVPSYDLKDFIVLINDQVFTCQKLPDYPNRWYCTGRMPNKANIHVKILTANTNLIAWEADAIIPVERITTGGSGGPGDAGGTGSGGGACCWIVESGPGWELWDCDPNCCAGSPDSCPGGGGDGGGGSGE
jgi:hypothetical protein